MTPAQEYRAIKSAMRADWLRENAARCAECDQPLTVEGDTDGTGDPWHVFCDTCGEAEHPAEMTYDWNGETGNHKSCEKESAA